MSKDFVAIVLKRVPERVSNSVQKNMFKTQSMRHDDDHHHSQFSGAVFLQNI